MEEDGVEKVEILGWAFSVCCQVGRWQGVVLGCSISLCLVLYMSSATSPQLNGTSLFPQALLIHKRWSIAYITVVIIPLGTVNISSSRHVPHNALSTSQS